MKGGYARASGPAGVQMTYGNRHVSKSNEHSFHDSRACAEVVVMSEAHSFVHAKQRIHVIFVTEGWHVCEERIARDFGETLMAT